MTFNLATILTETALAAPDAPAYRFMGAATTYGDLDEQSGRFEAGLREAGLETGDVVALQLPNVPHFLTAYFGALKAGMVVLPLNPLLMAPELEYHLGDSSAKLLIGFEGMHAEASKACERLGLPLYLVSFGAAPLPDAFVDQEPLLALHSPGVASHGAICADDPVARADDQQRVGADRGAQGHDPVPGDAELGGELAVGDRGAVPDGVQGLPDPLLERGAAGGEVQVEMGPLAGEVLFELPGDQGERCGRALPVGPDVRRVALAGEGHRRQRHSRLGLLTY